MGESSAAELASVPAGADLGIGFVAGFVARHLAGTGRVLGADLTPPGNELRGAGGVLR